MVVHKLDMNSEPLSEVMSSGIPKRAIHRAHVSVSVTFSGIASGLFVVCEAVKTRPSMK